MVDSAAPASAAPAAAGPPAPGLRLRASAWVGLALACLTAAAALVYPPMAKYDLYDPGLGGREGDVGLYVRMYQGAPLQSIARPWRYRVLTPLLARAVPLPPSGLMRWFDVDADKQVKYHFAVVNLFGLAASALLLVAFCGTLGFTALEGLVAALLFFTSYPVVVFGGTPMVDAWAYAFLLLGLVCARRRSAVGVALTVLVGVFAKETVLLLAPALLLLPLARRDRVRLLLALLPGVAAYAIFRFAIAPGGYGQPADPAHSFADIAAKLREGPWWAFLAFDGATAFGLLWPLALLGWLRVRRDPADPLRTFAALVPLVLVVPFLIGSNVGRIWFYAFPAVIPLAVRGLSGLLAPAERAA